MKANFDISAVTNKVRTSQVTFLGKCYNCDKTIDLSAKLSASNKHTLMQRYGVTVREGKIVCNKVVDIEFCTKCAQVN